jgi:hypothetical protein
VYPNTINLITYTGSLRDDARVSVSPHGSEGGPRAAVPVSGVHEPAPQSAPLHPAGMVSVRSRMLRGPARGIMAGITSPTSRKQPAMRRCSLRRF